MTRSLLLALALARAVALLDSPETPGLRGTISEAAEPAGQYSVRSKGRTLDFGYQDFFVGPLDDPFNEAMKAKGYVCDNTKDKVEQEINADALPPPIMGIAGAGLGVAKPSKGHDEKEDLVNLTKLEAKL